METISNLQNQIKKLLQERSSAFVKRVESIYEGYKISSRIEIQYDKENDYFYAIFENEKDPKVSFQVSEFKEKSPYAIRLEFKTEEAAIKFLLEE